MQINKGKRKGGIKRVRGGEGEREAGRYTKDGEREGEREVYGDRERERVEIVQRDVSIARPVGSEADPEMPSSFLMSPFLSCRHERRQIRKLGKENVTNNERDVST